MREVNIKLNHSLEKAISILDCFSLDTQYQTIENICKLVNIPKPTAYRLLYTMETLGLVHYNAEDSTYCLGMKMFGYGGIVLQRLNVIHAAAPYLTALHHKTGFSVLLAILESNHLVYIDKRVTIEGIGYTSTIGRFRDPHYGALGKVLMAYLEDSKIEKILQTSPLIKYTDFSITDSAAFLEQSRQIREQGYSIDNEEVILDVTAVAAPVKNKWDQVIAAVTIVGPKSKMHEYSISEIIKDVCHSTELISVELGNKTH
ncbi:IclR family transcriptional regulator [Peribacillus asahii]|uniref:IclR family transcriptional regulator n=1 Tax=Peribacillus asahii TaxID=228899 RepID=UPI0037FB0182